MPRFEAVPDDSGRRTPARRTSSRRPGRPRIRALGRVGPATACEKAVREPPGHAPRSEARRSRRACDRDSRSSWVEASAATNRAATDLDLGDQEPRSGVAGSVREHADAADRAQGVRSRQEGRAGPGQSPRIGGAAIRSTAGVGVQPGGSTTSGSQPQRSARSRPRRSASIPSQVRSRSRRGVDPSRRAEPARRRDRRRAGPRGPGRGADRRGPIGSGSPTSSSTASRRAAHATATACRQSRLERPPRPSARPPWAFGRQGDRGRRLSGRIAGPGPHQGRARPPRAAEVGTRGSPEFGADQDARARSSGGGGGRPAPRADGGGRGGRLATVKRGTHRTGLLPVGDATEARNSLEP